MKTHTAPIPHELPIAAIDVALSDSSNKINHSDASYQSTENNKWPQFIESEQQAGTLNVNSPLHALIVGSRPGVFATLPVHAIAKKRSIFVYGNFSFTAGAAFRGIQIALDCIRGGNVLYTIPWIQTNESVYANQGESFMAQSRGRMMTGGGNPVDETLALFISNPFGAEIGANPQPMQPKPANFNFDVLQARIVAIIGVDPAQKNRFYMAVDTYEI